MSELEELHELIEIAAEDVCYNSEGYGPSSLAHAVAADAADAVLAAGYRKPRTITTAEELESLAAESVLLAGSRVYQKDRGALMDLGIGLLGYEEVLDECGRLLCVWEPTA